MFSFSAFIKINNEFKIEIIKFSFLVTTTETQNVTEAEPTSMGSHKINCSAKWNGYCMNGGRCTFLLEQATAACE